MNPITAALLENSRHVLAHCEVVLHRTDERMRLTRLQLARSRHILDRLIDAEESMASPCPPSGQSR